MREWLVIYYDDCAEAIDTDLLHMEEQDVLLEAFFRLESYPTIVKVIVYTTKEDGDTDRPFAVINKVVS